MTIKIVVGQQLFILAISTVKCRNGWPANKQPKWLFVWVLRWNEKAERIKAKVQYLAFASSFASCVGDAHISYFIEI